MCVADVGIFTNLVFVAGLGTCSMRVRVRLQDIAYNIIIFVWFGGSGGGVRPLPYYFRARVEAIVFIIIIIISYTI